MSSINPVPISSDSDMSEAIENPALSLSDDDIPTRGWRSVNKRLADQTVSPSNKRHGMFDMHNRLSPTPSSRPPLQEHNLKTSGPAIPKKRGFGMFDGTAREDLPPPPEPAKKPTSKFKERIAKFSNKSHVGIKSGGHTPFAKSTPLRPNVGATPSVQSRDKSSSGDTLKKDSDLNKKAKRAKIIREAVAQGNEEHQLRMDILYSGGDSETKTKYVAPTVEDSHSQTPLSTLSPGDESTESTEPVKPVEPVNCSFAQDPSSTEPQSAAKAVESDGDLYDGITDEQKPQIIEVLRLEAVIGSNDSSQAAQRTAITELEKKRDAACAQLVSIKDDASKVAAGILARRDEEIAKLKDAIRLCSESAEKNIREIWDRAERDRAKAEQDKLDCEDHKEIELKTLSKARESFGEAEKTLEKIYHKGGYKLGEAVGIVRERQRQKLTSSKRTV